LEEKINRTLESRKQFIELKSVNAVLDTLNNLYYDIGPDGNYIIDSEYTLNDVTEDWWAQLANNPVIKFGIGWIKSGQLYRHFCG
jgi:hypothetical protein